jgi:uncharacterized protein
MSEPLLNLYLVLVQECNLACTYCYAAGGNFGQPAQRMSAAVMRRALDRFLPRAGERLTLSFFGGEPLLDLPLLRETVDYAGDFAVRAGKRISFSLTTNGVLLNDDTIGFIAAHVDHLAVSLDGDRSANAGRVFHDGQPAFDTITRNLAMLRERGVAFGLRATVTPVNVDRLIESAEFLAGLGAETVRILPAHDLHWSAASYRRLLTATVELNRRGLNMLLAGETPPGCEQTYRLIGHRTGLFSATRPCLAGDGILAVAADGTVYPCEHFVGVASCAMGNVNDAEFPAGRFRAVENRFGNCTVDSRSRCVACAVRAVCGGQCYAAAFAATGDIARPDPRHCALIRTVFNEIDPAVVTGLGNAESARVLRRAVSG